MSFEELIFKEGCIIGVYNIIKKYQIQKFQ